MLPIVRKFEEPYRFVDYHNDIFTYPEHWPPYYNGGILCDMLQGPCACGATHSLTEWAIGTKSKRPRRLAERSTLDETRQGIQSP